MRLRLLAAGLPHPPRPTFLHYAHGTGTRPITPRYCPQFGRNARRASLRFLDHLRCCRDHGIHRDCDADSRHMGAQGLSRRCVGSHSRRLDSLGMACSHLPIGQLAVPPRGPAKERIIDQSGSPEPASADRLHPPAHRFEEEEKGHEKLLSLTTLWNAVETGAPACLPET